MKKLRLGVLGCSNLYAAKIAPPLQKSALIEPYAIASRDEAKARRFAEGRGFSHAYGSYEALLADPAVDFVYIPLPNHLHCEYIKKAADAGKPVICEKPLCLSAREAADAAEYCRKKNVPLMEAFMYRFHPQWIRAKEIASAGELGEILSVNGHYSYMNKDGGNIRNIAEFGGGALYDIGCYMVSSARFLFGREPRRVMGTLTRDPVFKTDIFAGGILDFGEGRTANFSVSTQMFPHQRVIAAGSNGRLSLEIPFNMHADVPARVTVTTGIGGRTIETAAADQYLLEFEAFARAVSDKAPVPTPAADAVANMAVLDALFKSAETGAWESVVNY